MKTELAYVKKGLLSDKPDVGLYMKRRMMDPENPDTSAVEWWCLRTSSALEGYHQALGLTCGPNEKSAGLSWLEPVTNEFDWRTTVKALVSRGGLPPWLRHYDLSLLDRIVEMAAKLGVENAMPGWERVEREHNKSLVLQHGSFYAADAERDVRLGLPMPAHPHLREASAEATVRASALPVGAATPAATATATLPVAPILSRTAKNTIQILAERVGIRGVAKSMTAHLVAGLFQDGSLLNDPIAFVRLAHTLSIPLAKASAEAFLESVKKDDKAYGLLLANGRPGLKRAMLRPVPASPSVSKKRDHATMMPVVVAKTHAPMPRPLPMVGLGAAASSGMLCVQPIIALAHSAVDPDEATPENETTIARKRRLARLRNRRARRRRNGPSQAGAASSGTASSRTASSGTASGRTSNGSASNGSASTASGDTPSSGAAAAAPAAPAAPVVAAAAPTSATAEATAAAASI